MFENHLEDLILDLKIYNLFPRNYISSVIYGKFCNEVPDFCNFFLKSFGTLDPDIDNVSRFSSKMAHSPSGSGWRNLVHYA